MKKKGECLKCGSKEQMTMHHVIPKVFRVPTRRVRLCRSCHNLIEKSISEEEHRIGNLHKGERYQLRNIDYIYILDTFLNG